MIYEMFILFSHYVFNCFQILCFSMSNHLNAKNSLIYSNVFLKWPYDFFSQEFCVAYLHFSGYQIKA